MLFEEKEKERPHLLLNEGGICLLLNVQKKKKKVKKKKKSKKQKANSLVGKAAMILELWKKLRENTGDDFENEQVLVGTIKLAVKLALRPH